MDFSREKLVFPRHYPESLLHAVANHEGGGPLSSHQVEKLSEEFGPNSIETEKKHPCYMILLQAFLHPFNILLCIIAISSYVASLQDKDGADYSTTIIISVMILISTILRFYQEWKSKGAVQGLLLLITKYVSVVRVDPIEPIVREMTVPSDELVPGDWVVLRPFEVVPADAVVLASKVFFVSQAPLTGEAIPVEKYSYKEKMRYTAAANSEDSSNQNDERNASDVENIPSPMEVHKPVSKIQRFFRMICGLKVTAESQLDKGGNLLREDLSSPENVFTGSQVICGMATVRVLRTGHDTLFGKMAKVLQRAQTANPFQRGVKRISWIFFLIMALMIPPVFLIYGFTHVDDEHRWTTAFLFSLSVVVGLTPETLPMIVNANLAKGSMELSKKYSIVKKLDAIINLGAVDIICTDKTGTLTKSVIHLSSHVDPHGNISYIPLQIAFLNSYFQSVLQNPLDIVSFYDKVISPPTDIPTENNEENDLPTEKKTFLVADATGFAKKFSRLDELPFDFVRRRLSIIIKQSIQNNDDKVYLICKGAVEETLAICTKSLKDNVQPVSDDDVFPPESSTITLQDSLRQDLMGQYKIYTDRGERVLAVAYKSLPGNKAIIKPEDEKDMVFAGFISFMDPPKSTTSTAIASLLKHNIEVKVLTGDAANICVTVCKSINLPVKDIVTGSDIDAAMRNGNLAEIVEHGTIFAKLTPLQKAEVVRSLKAGNHVVGFIGDGINDAPALKEADVGISVENGVDICRESADIILLDKDLNVVVDGIRIGRKTYGNTIKYIVMAISSNFGNVFSVLVAAAWIPFEPMTSLQILTQNLLYDISQIAIPWDSMDEEFLYVPHKWKMKSILRFMVFMGPQSSIFDIGTFAYMYITLDIKDKKNAKDENKQMLFQTTWFAVGLLTQTLIVHIIRTPKIPLFQSRASLPLTLLTVAVMGISFAIPYIPEINTKLKLSSLPDNVYIFVVIVLCSYCVVATIAKLIYVKVFKEWF